MRAGWSTYPGLVPMSPEGFYAHAMCVADAEGRLPLSRCTLTAALAHRSRYGLAAAARVRAALRSE
jgi:hypothetical protein